MHLTKLEMKCNGIYSSIVWVCIFMSESFVFSVVAGLMAGVIYISVAPISKLADYSDNRY